MDDYEARALLAEHRRKELLGKRIRLISCTDEFTRLQPGAMGTVGHVDDLGTLHIDFDDGHRLGLILGVDRWEVVA